MQTWRGQLARFVDHAGLEGLVLGGADILPAVGATTVTVPILVAGTVWGAVVIEASPGQHFTDADVEFLYAVSGHIADAVVEAQRAAETSKHAWLDPLTGLGNRRRLEAALSGALANHSPDAQPVSVVLLDVDGLKSVNDVEGHAAGDALISRTAQVLAELAAARPDITACRTGGDEFCLVLGATTAREAARLVEEAFYRASTTEAPIQVSGGCCANDGGVQTREQLLARADEALYRAKQTARGLVLVAGSGPTPAAADSARGRRRFRDRQASPVECLVLAGSKAIASSTDRAARTAAVAQIVAETLDAVSVVIAVTTPDGLQFPIDTRPSGHGRHLPAITASVLPGLHLEIVGEADVDADRDDGRPAAIVGWLCTPGGPCQVRVDSRSPVLASAAAIAAVELLLTLAGH